MTARPEEEVRLAMVCFVAAWRRGATREGLK